jgi:hypothetical protein
VISKKVTDDMSIEINVSERKPLEKHPFISIKPGPESMKICIDLPLFVRPKDMIKDELPMTRYKFRLWNEEID